MNRVGEMYISEAGTLYVITDIDLVENKYYLLHLRNNSTHRWSLDYLEVDDYLGKNNLLSILYGFSDE